MGLILAFVPASGAQDVAFNRSRFSSVKQPKEISVNLTLTNSTMLIKDKKGSALDEEIAYSKIDSMSYELAQRHRVAEGASVMVLSLGAGAIVMATKSKSHWLTVDYHETGATQEVVLRLDKSEYQGILDALESRTGKKIEMRTVKTGELNPNAGSKDVDILVPFPMEKVKAALKPAMENEGCNVTEESANRVICKRKRGGSERTGNGGEEVAASLAVSGNQTRVRIVTGKGFVGRAGKKNWSTSIYNGMAKSLQTEMAKTP
jgi:hypothetical protein